MVDFRSVLSSLVTLTIDFLISKWRHGHPFPSCQFSAS